VTSVLSDLVHQPPADVLELIESAWAEGMKRIGSILYDGPMVRLESWRVDDGRLHLELGRTSYKIFWGTNLHNSNLADKYGRSVLANPLGLSAVLHSSDGFLLMGRRNARVAYYPNRVHPFAGSATESDVFAGIRRELREELALEETDITDVRCIGLAEDNSIRQPELIFSVQSSLTHQRIESRLDATEHSALVAIRATSTAVNFATKNPELTPIAQASLALWQSHIK
jgi:hypothetical protein